MPAVLDIHDAAARRADRIDSAEDAVREEILRAFTVLLPQTGRARSISVPYVQNLHGCDREVSTTVSEAISELIGEGSGHRALIEVLERSRCPLVQELREQLASVWAHQVAADVAMVRGDQ